MNVVTKILLRRKKMSKLLTNIDEYQSMSMWFDSFQRQIRLRRGREEGGGADCCWCLGKRHRGNAEETVTLNRVVDSFQRQIRAFTMTELQLRARLQEALNSSTTMSPVAERGAWPPLTKKIILLPN